MTAAPDSSAVRPLTAADLDRVVAIDSAASGRPRRGFFDKRLEAALTDPKGFVYVGYDDDGDLAGFMMCRLLEGEFGGTAPVAVMDAMGVDPNGQGRGIGRSLLAATEAILRHKGVREVQSESDWRQLPVLRFFAATGFRVAPRYVLEREVGASGIEMPAAEDEADDAPREIDYSDPDTDDCTALSRDRIPCRSLRRDDTPALERIDRKVMGRDRSTYLQRKIAEVLDESGIRVSMVAESDGTVVGFVMARVDFGEFGRTEPYAVLDTISVDPGFQHRQVGTALLSQLLANLTTLRVDRVRTEVGYDRHQLAAFLQRCGFVPSQQLAFSLGL